MSYVEKTFFFSSLGLAGGGASQNEGPSWGATNYDEWAYEQVLPPVSDDED